MRTHDVVAIGDRVIDHARGILGNRSPRPSTMTGSIVELRLTRRVIAVDDHPAVTLSGFPVTMRAISQIQGAALGQGAFFSGQRVGCKCLAGSCKARIVRVERKVKLILRPNGSFWRQLRRSAVGKDGVWLIRIISNRLIHLRSELPSGFPLDFRTRYKYQGRDKCT